MEVFEGMKAYRQADGSIGLFRPEKNMDRMLSSCLRMGLPAFDKDEALEGIKQLVDLDRDWVPEGDGYSLYIRPAMIADGAGLGVGPSKSALFFTITSPVGPYYPTGFAPVRLYASTKYVRAWPGGTGAAKCGGNYAATIVPQVEAAKAGYAQVLWLQGEDDLLTEVGTMNLFVYWTNEAGKKEVVTAPLGDGTVLAGVTRRSVMDICKAKGINVVERYISMAELIQAVSDKRVIESFGSGTAAVVSPVAGFNYKDVDYDIPINNDLKAGELTHELWETLYDIQYGRRTDEWNKDWVQRL